MRKLSLLLILPLMIACNQENKPNKRAPFQQHSSFKIHEVNKDNNEIVDSEEQSGCKNWILSKEEITTVINSSEEISKHDWHYLFDHLPCVISGKLIQDNREFNFEINAGSWLRISNQDTVLYFGSFREENKKLFLSSVYAPED